MSTKHYLLTLCALLPLLLSAQISLDVSDMPALHQRYTKAYINQNIQFDATTGGINGQWDVSDIKYDNRQLDTTTLSAPNETEYEKEFPGATIVMNEDGIRMMAKVHKDGIEWLGGLLGEDTITVIKFDEPFRFLQLPMTHRDSHADEFSFEMKRDIGPNISMISETTFKRSYEVNGYGSLKMKDGKTYDVIRVKVQEVDSSLFTFKSQWGEQSTTEIDYSYYYEFWAKGFGQPLVRVDVDSTDHSQALNIEILDMEGTSVGLSSITNNLAPGLFPNPGQNTVEIINANEVSQTVFHDITSKRIHTLSPNQSSLDISHLNSGFYLVHFLDADGKTIGHQKYLVQ